MNLAAGPTSGSTDHLVRRSVSLVQVEARSQHIRTPTGFILISLAGTTGKLKADWTGYLSPFSTSRTTLNSPPNTAPLRSVPPGGVLRKQKQLLELPDICLLGCSIGLHHGPAIAARSMSDRCERDRFGFITRRRSCSNFIVPLLHPESATAAMFPHSFLPEPAQPWRYSE